MSNGKQRIVSVFAGRFPSGKAAAIFEDLNAESFARAGHETVVLAPRRLGRGTLPNRSYRTVLLPTIDLTNVPLVGPVAGYIHTLVFSVSVFVWLSFRGRSDDVIISNDIVPLLVATLLHDKTMYEMHDFADRSLGMYRRLFRRATWILATNEWKQRKLVTDLGVPNEKIILERNAVDVDAFGKTDIRDARNALHLPVDTPIVMYTGHLYEWKGADTLARAAARMPDVSVVFVGGTTGDIARFSSSWAGVPNIRIVGHVAHDDIPLWQSAADVLVLPNSAKEEISIHYTSPMKLFEYMASQRAIVASDLPSIREILPESVGYFAKPDDAESFAVAIRQALTDPATGARAKAGRELAAHYSWQKRAERILSRII